MDAAELQRFSERYARILDKHSVNHEGVDFDQYRLEHSEKYPLGFPERALVRLRAFVVAQLPNGLMIIIIGFFFALFFYHVLPVRLATETTPVPSTVAPGMR